MKVPVPLLNRILPRRRLTVRDWWAYLGSFGDDFFSDDGWAADAPSSSH